MEHTVLTWYPVLSTNIHTYKQPHVCAGIAMLMWLQRHKTVLVVHQTCVLAGFGTLDPHHSHIPWQKTICPVNKASRTHSILRNFTGIQNFLVYKASIKLLQKKQLRRLRKLFPRNSASEDSGVLGFGSVLVSFLESCCHHVPQQAILPTVLRLNNFYTCFWRTLGTKLSWCKMYVVF